MIVVEEAAASLPDAANASSTPGEGAVRPRVWKRSHRASLLGSGASMARCTTYALSVVRVCFRQAEGSTPGSDSGHIVIEPFSWGCLPLSSWLRRTCLRVMAHPVFEKTVMLVIVLNCATLALMDPLDSDETTVRSRVVRESEPVFTALFTVEMLIKVWRVRVCGCYALVWTVARPTGRHTRIGRVPAPGQRCGSHCFGCKTGAEFSAMCPKGLWGFASGGGGCWALLGRVFHASVIFSGALPSRPLLDTPPHTLACASTFCDSIAVFTAGRLQ